MKGSQGFALHTRMMKYFTEHPEEELSITDMAHKFSCTVAHVYKALRRLKLAGFTFERTYVYRKAKDD